MNNEIEVFTDFLIQTLILNYLLKSYQIPDNVLMVKLLNASQISKMSSSNGHAMLPDFLNCSLSEPVIHKQQYT